MVVDNLYGTVLQSTEKQVVNNAHGGFIHLSLCDDISGFSLASAYWASTVFAVCVCYLVHNSDIHIHWTENRLHFIALLSRFRLHMDRRFIATRYIRSAYYIFTKIRSKFHVSITNFSFTRTRK